MPRKWRPVLAHWPGYSHKNVVGSIWGWACGRIPGRAVYLNRDLLQQEMLNVCFAATGLAGAWCWCLQLTVNGCRMGLRMYLHHRFETSEAGPREVSSATDGTAIRMPLSFTGRTGKELMSPPWGFAAGTLLMSVCPSDCLLSGGVQVGWPCQRTLSFLLTLVTFVLVSHSFSTDHLKLGNWGLVKRGRNGNSLLLFKY